MRVLHIISSLDPRSGGPVNAIEGLSKALINADVNVDLITTYREGADSSVADRLSHLGITIQRVGPVRTPLQRHRRLSPTVREGVEKADIIHIHGLWEEIQHHAAKWARRLNKPYIIRPCGMLDPWSLGQSRWRKRLYLALRLRRNLNHASALHFTAEEELRLTKPLGLTASAIIEPNGLNLADFEQLPPPGTFRDANPMLKDRPYVLFLSRIHPKKGLDLLIPAFAKAAPPEYMLVVAGPGEQNYIDSLNQLALKFGIADRMLMPGMLTGDHKLAAYIDAKLFILPSYQENFGIVTVESLACGTPVLISDKVNIYHEIVKENVGIACTTEDESITSALSACLRDGRLINQPPDQQKNFAMINYDWEKIANRWVESYRKLTGVT